MPENPVETAQRSFDIGFVMEQALGHITHTKNLQAQMPRHRDVQAHWALVDFEATGIAARIPVFKSNWTVRAGVRARRQLAEIAQRVTLDVLFFHTQVPAILAQPWLRKIPSIVSLDATPLQYDQLGAFYQHDKGSDLIETVKWRLNQSCYRAARRLVVWSDWTRRGLIEGYGVPDDKITVLPPGVIVRDWLRPQPRSLHRVEDPVKVLFVGGDLERKGGHLLLEAFRTLRNSGLGVELHLVTRDRVPPEPGLFVYNSMQPNTPELKALYHRCDIFALPTYGDCLPMVLSEAGVAGMAVISTEVAGIPEIVRDGKTGVIIPTGSVAHLIEALRALATRPELRLELGSHAIEHVTRTYDAEKNADRLIDLLKAEAKPECSVGV